MNSQEKFEYWLDAAQSDLEHAADTLIFGRGWIYVAYFCQQAVEKLVKGLYTLYNGDPIPRIHNIDKLIKKFEDKLPIYISEERHIFFNYLSNFYIVCRYPNFKLKLSASLSKKEVEQILTKTKEVFQWLLTLKP